MITSTEISFTYEYIDTDIFEQAYEEELREEKEIRDAVIRNGLVVYMYLDNTLIGESFGISPYEYMTVIDQGQGFYLEEFDSIEDVDMSDNESIYVWSTTILPQFRGMGYGKALRQEFARYAWANGYAKLVGHATSKAMVQIVRELGAIFHATHENWFGTNRTAHFYTQFLTQTKEYNCGPFALAYLLETKGHIYSIKALEEQCGTTYEYGTNPTSIEKFLQRRKIPYRRMREDLVEDSIIDITVENEGHWITLIQYMSGMWQVYDPDKGIRLIAHKELLKAWHSPRYGIHKGITLV